MGALKHTIKVREIPGEPMRFFVESWTRPTKKYEGRDLTRDQAVAEMERLLTLERIA